MPAAFEGLVAEDSLMQLQPWDNTISLIVSILKQSSMLEFEEHAFVKIQ